MRPLRSTLTTLSLLLAAATALLWIRSHWTNDTLTRHTLDGDHRRGDEYKFESNAGLLHLSHTIWRFDTPEGFDLLSDESRRVLGWRYTRNAPTRYDFTGGTTLQKLGFYHHASHTSHHATRVRPVRLDAGTFTIDDVDITLPHWFLALILALPALPAALHLRRRWLLKPPGHCPRCGYDLRATPDRCPECGHLPEP